MNLKTDRENEFEDIYVLKIQNIVVPFLTFFECNSN